MKAPLKSSTACWKAISHRPDSALTPEQANEKIGLPVDKESVYFPLGGWLSPLQLTQGLIGKLEETNQVSAHYQHQVTQLEWLEAEQQWLLTIETLQGEIQTKHDQVVVANGHKFTQFEQTRQYH